MRTSELKNSGKNILNLQLTISFIFLIYFIGFSVPLKAQDILKLKSGTELKVTITEENADVIKYKEYNNPSGPVYSVGRDKVESVQYKKGTKERLSAGAVTTEPAVKEPVIQTAGTGELTYKRRKVYQDGVPQSTRDIKTLMEDNPEALNRFEKGRKMLGASTSCAAGVVVTSFISGMASKNKTDESERMAILTTGLVIDGVFIITAIILGSAGNSNIKKSLTLYNSSVGKPLTYKVDFGIQDNGVGFGLKF
jgi:hypothetical protein